MHAQRVHRYIPGTGNRTEIPGGVDRALVQRGELR
jgi:hypothetical protein